MKQACLILYSKNIPVKQIAKILGLHRATVYKYIQEATCAKRVATAQDIGLLREAGLSYREISLIIGLSHTQCWRLGRVHVHQQEELGQPQSQVGR